MKLVFVNNAHPRTPHVSGMRLYEFARCMARRGHQVILLTGPAPDQDPPERHRLDLASLLGAHDWSEPLVVPVPPLSDRWLQAARAERVPALLRRALTAWHFVAHGGVFSDWTRAAEPVARQIASLFSPDLVWATFGNTSNLALGRFLARRARCPWIVDAKDNWDTFVPGGLRRLMALRLRDASGLTSNAEHHLRIARRWFRRQKSAVVYSGVVDEFYEARRGGGDARDPPTIMLVGGTYSTEVLSRFLGAFREWGGRAAGGVVLQYAGSDTARVQSAIDAAGLSSGAVAHGQLPLPELAVRVRRAVLVCYLWAPFTFHHKLLELLILGVPVASFPGEHAESVRLASACPTPFFACRDVVELTAAFDQALAMNRPAPACATVPDWRWCDFGVVLETFFTTILAEEGLACAA